MKVTIPSHLSDAELDAAVRSLAGKELETTGERVAHLAELDGRPGVYAGQGYGSLFSYSTQALRLSEDAACNRIEAARTCRRFPVILPAALSQVPRLGLRRRRSYRRRAQSSRRPGQIHERGWECGQRARR